MRLVITEKQLQELIRLHSQNQEIKEEGEAGAPESGTSSDGEQKTNATKWESGVTRGPGNQIGVTKWSETVGSKISRGKANPLSEQKAQLVKVSKYVYKEDDGENFFVNLSKGEISEALLDLRAFMFSGWGLATQIVVGIVGSEVGAPVALTAIDAAIVLNDFYLYAEQGMNITPPDNIKSPWEKFKWLLTNNPNFLRIVEDVIFIATLGVVKGASRVITYFTKNSAGFAGFIKLFRTAIGKISKGIDYVPGKLGVWAKQRIGVIKKLDQHFIELNNSGSKIARAVGKLPKATYTAALTTLGFAVGLNTLSYLLRSKTPINPKEVSDELIANKGQTIENLAIKKGQIMADLKIVENSLYAVIISDPKYKNTPRDQFKVTNQKKDGESIFIIMGKKYYINPNLEIERI